MDALQLALHVADAPGSRRLAADLPGAVAATSGRRREQDSHRKTECGYAPGLGTSINELPRETVWKIARGFVELATQDREIEVVGHDMPALEASE